jgi:gliding motility-associated-like protein
LLNLSTSLSLTASSNSVCPGTNFTLTATNPSGGAGSSYTFQQLPVGNVIPAISANQAVANTAALPATFQVLSDSSGCVGNRTITIGRLDINGLGLSASPTVVCAGRPTTITATSHGNTVTASSVNYTFIAVSSTATVPVVSSSPTLVVTPTVPTVYVMAMDSLGCKINTLTAQPVTISVNILPALTLSATATSQSVCAGLPTTISVSSGTVTNVSYTWTPLTAFGTLTPAAPPSASAVAFQTVAGTYTIIGMDQLGCKGTETITIGIDPLATLSVNVSSTSNTICPMIGGPGATLSAVCNINPVTFAWTPSIGLSPTVGSSVVASPTVTGSYVYSATADNGYGCTGTGTYTLQVGPPPNMNIVTTASAVCQGYNAILTAFGATSYTWTSATFSNAVIQQSVSVGPGTYSVRGSNGGSCIDSTAYIVIGIANPLNITTALSPATGTTCIENNNPKYSKPTILSASGANTYVWFPFNPVNMTYSLGPTTTVRPPASTCYTVIGTTPVCSGSAIVCVTVAPQFTMGVLPPIPYMCVGDSLKLSIVNISSLAAGPASAFNYSWTEAVNAPLSLSSKFTPTVLAYPQQSTTYSVQVKDSRGCVSQPGLVTLTVLPRPVTAIAIPTINNVPTNTICYVGLNPGPEDVLLTLTGTNKNTNLPFGLVPTYTWNAPYPSKYTSILTPPNNPAITVNAPLKLPEVVTYSLLSGYNGVPGCSRLDTVSVRVIDCRPVTAVTFTTGEKLDTICARYCITFINSTDTAAGGTQTVSWTFKGGNPPTSNLPIQTVCYNLPGSYDVILTVSNPYPKSPPNGQTPGSSGNLGVKSYVKVVDVPNVTIVAPGQLRSDTTVRFGTPISLKASGAIYYSWSPNYNITSLTAKNVTVTPFKNTQYILTGYNGGHCMSSDTLNVFVIEDCGEMYVPNAFSPNGDGHNDVLYVRGLCLKTLSFMVFNRWGEKVFETNDVNVGWDGKYHDEDLNTGVFVYRLEGRTYDGKQYTAKGNVTLIR